MMDDLVNGGAILMAIGVLSTLVSYFSDMRERNAKPDRNFSFVQAIRSLDDLNDKIIIDKETDDWIDSHPVVIEQFVPTPFQKWPHEYLKEKS